MGKPQKGLSYGATGVFPIISLEKNKVYSAKLTESIPQLQVVNKIPACKLFLILYPQKLLPGLSENQ
jgi:hypothetical protein